MLNSLKKNGPIEEENIVLKANVPEHVDDERDQLDKSDQHSNGTGKFRPKFIIPSVDIFQTSQQEKYIDDVEFSLFDFVPDEGGNGGMENPLVRSNNVNQSIRFQGAGVMLDNRLLYNKDITDKLSDSELEVLYLGHKLPALTFVDQNPADTFRYQAQQFYVNNENVSIEMFSPYSEYSNTDTYWTSFPKNVLYSKVP